MADRFAASDIVTVITRSGRWRLAGGDGSGWYLITPADETAAADLASRPAPVELRHPGGGIYVHERYLHAEEDPT